MKTMKLIKLCSFFILFFLVTNSYSQNVGRILKKKTEKLVDKTLDKGIDKIGGKEGKKKDKDGNIIVDVEKRTPVKNFINGTIIFSDDFNNEKHGEFPSKWTQINGTMQNSQIIAHGQKEGVVQFITSAKMKPTFKKDDYLGKSFKIEGQFYFHGKGNEAYTLYLGNNNDRYQAYSITVRGDGIVPSGSSHQYARMPNRMSYPGWRTVQLSFNNGILKVSLDGYPLINIPILRGYKSKEIKEFTHLELSALSRSGDYGAMVNHITIGYKGLPLYKKLVAEGRLIVHDIHFDVDSYLIKPSSYPAIDRIVTMLQNNPDAFVTIEGHTDANGPKASNQTLSENRAKAIMNHLVIKGVDANRLKTVGYGEDRPMVSGNNEEAWSLNRRAEFVLKQ